MSISVVAHSVHCVSSAEPLLSVSSTSKHCYCLLFHHMQSNPSSYEHSKKFEFFGSLPPEFDKFVTNLLSLPKYRSEQVRNWVYLHAVADPQQMLNLSKSDRQRLADAVTFV